MVEILFLPDHDRRGESNPKELSNGSKRCSHQRSFCSLTDGRKKDVTREQNDIEPRGEAKRHGCSDVPDFQPVNKGPATDDVETEH